MSECLTIDVVGAEEKYPDEELTTAKDIVQSILTDALHSVVVSTEKDSNCIGDCRVGEEFLPEFRCFPVYCSGSEEIRESCEVKKMKEEEKEEKKPKEYKVIKEQALADSELRFEKGKIHLQANGAKAVVNLSREPTNLGEICPAKEVNKSQSCVKGGSDKKVESSSENVLVVKPGQEKPEERSKEAEPSDDKRGEECAECERPFTPFTTEDLRKSILHVWKNVNSPVLNSWDGELMNQPQEVIKVMEELATIRVAADPNRPRACTFVEEDVRKQMIKEIGDMNFKSSLAGGEEENISDKKGIAKDEQNPAEEMRAAEKGQEDCSEEVVQLLSVPSGSAVGFESRKFNKSFGFDVKEEMFAVSLTESDEAFIESTESVIQVIEPQDDSNEENEEGSKITFSLLNESDKDGEMMDDYESHEEYDDGVHREEEDELFPRHRSGMTTVGPVKSPVYDPKILTGPEVIYGKMIRISGSRELKKETVEGNSRSSSSRKIFLDDSEDNPVIFFENGYMEFDTIVNHDIASLTKMQKVKEVLSDQPKSDEDLRSDEKLIKSPLDLKDVDADFCDSYSVIDLGIPLLTVEETNLNNQNKDICQTEEGFVNESNLRKRDTRVSNPEEEKKVEREDKGKDETVKSDSANDETPVKLEDHLLISSSFGYNKSVTQLNTGQSQKHNTISKVFQKASNRFIMKDSDSFLRNSRSLPRDTSKITNTESFRSLLGDAQTSAVTVLLKSRSLLRNTQNALKAVSKTGFSHVVSGDKQVYAAPDIAVEKADSSTCSKRNEFLKMKDTIKNKVGKTLKSFENMKTEKAGNKGEDIRDEGFEQSENQKNLSPKSPLVCANQLLPKQSCENQKIECEGSVTLLEERRGENFDAKESVREGNRTLESDDDGNESPEKEIEVICGVKFQGTRRFAVSNEYSTSPQDESNDASSDRIDYIVMGTIRGNIEPETPEEEEKDADHERARNATGVAANAGKLADAKKSEYIGSETLSKGKLTRKNKKLSERIRSFWQTAFGKAKATTQKKDVS